MTDTAQAKRPSFGFGTLDDIQPRAIEVGETETSTASPVPPNEGKPRASAAKRDAAPARTTASSRAADDAAARLGFGSREPLVRRRKRQPIEEPVEQINLRAAVADINVFIEWCERKRYSYREGFAELVKHIDR